MKISCNIFFTTTVFLLFSTSILGSSKDVAGNAFESLKALVGDWRKVGTDGKRFRVNFSLTARESVIVETWLYDGESHSLTLYHKDKDSLLATHYCPQGNQPRLAMSVESSSQAINFSFKDATNLLSLDDSHQHELGFRLSKSGATIVRNEIYFSKEGEDKASLNLERIPLEKQVKMLKNSS